MGAVRRWSRRLLRAAAWAVIITVVLGTAAVLWAGGTRSGRAFVLHRVVTLLEAQVLDAEVHVAELSRVFGGVVLQDVRVAAADGRPVFDAARVEVRYRILPLVRARVSVSELVIDGTRAEVRVTEEGELNVAELVRVQPDRPDGPTRVRWTVALPDIRATFDEVTFTDHRTGEHPIVEVAGLESVASVLVGPSGGVGVHVIRTGGHLIMPVDTDFQVDDARVAVEPGAVAASVDALRVGGTEARTLAAAVELADDLPFARIDLTIPPFEVEPDDLNPLIPADAALLVPLRVGVEAHGSPSAITVRLPLEGAGGEANVTAAIDITTDPGPTWTGTLRLTRFAPSEWIALDFDADISAVLQVEGVGYDPATADVSARLDLGPSHAAGFALDEGLIHASREGGTLRLTALDVRRGSGRMQANAEVDRHGSVTATVDVSAPDVSELLAELRFRDVAELRGDVRLATELEADLGFDPLDRTAYPEGVDAWLDLLRGLSGSGEARVRRFSGLGASVRRLDASWTSEGGGEANVDVATRVADATVGGLEIDGAQVNLALRGESLRVSGEASGWDGDIRARTVLAARYEDDVIVDIAELDATAGEIDATLVEPVRVRVGLDRDERPASMQLEQALVSVLGAEIGVGARYDLRSGEIDAELSAGSVDIAPVGEMFLPSFGIAGFAAFRLTTAGTLDRPEGTIDLEVSRLSALGVEAYDLRVDGALERSVVHGAVQLSRRDALVAEVRTGDEGVPLDLDVRTGRVGLDRRARLRVEGAVDHLKLGALAPVLPENVVVASRGYLSADFGVRGTFEHPQAVLSVSVDDAELGVAAAGTTWSLERASAAARLRVDGSGVRWAVASDASVSVAGRDVVTATAVTDVDGEALLVSPSAAARDAEVDAELHVHGLTANELPPAVLRIWDVRSGQVDADARWSGRIPAGEGDVSVIATDLVLGHLAPVSAALQATAGETIVVTAAARYGGTPPPPESIESDGGYTAPESDAALRQATSLRGRSTPPEGNSAPPEGSSSAVGSGVSNSAPPEGNSSAVGSGVSTAAPRVPGDRLGGVDVALDVQLGASLAELFGSELPLAAPVAARVSVPSAPVAELAAILSPTGTELGTVGGYFDAWGTLGDPVALGRFALRDVTLIDGSSGAAGLEISYADGRGALSAVTCDGGVDGIDIDAAVGVELGAASVVAGLPSLLEWPVELSVRADAVQLASAVPRVLVAAMFDRIEGVLDADVRVAGTVGSPQVVGGVALTEGRVGVIPLSRSFENVQLEVVMSPSGAELRELVVEDGRGRVRGEGSLTLSDGAFATALLDLRARDFLLSSTSGLAAFVSGRTALDVRTTEDALRADIRLTDVEIDVPDDVSADRGGPRALPEWVYFEEEQVRADQRGLREPMLIEETAVVPAAPLAVDLTVVTENNGAVHHQLADIEFTTDLDIRVRGAGLSIEGEIGLPAGVVRVAGKDFEVVDRRITFPEGAEEIDPYIDVEAVHDLGPVVTDYLADRGWLPSGDTATVKVVIRGTASQLAADPDAAVLLVADPRGLSQPDILQLLTSGRLADDSEGSGGQQGVGVLASVLTGLVGDRVAGRIPIDTIRVEGSAESQRVEGGKYIADNVYVSGTYIRSPDDEEDNNFEVALEWILRQIGRGTLRLELRGGDRAKGGLELLYNLVRTRSSAAHEDGER